MKWFKNFTKLANTGQSRAIILCGNVHDMFFDGNNYVPLIEYICSQSKVEADPTKNKKGIIQLVYELNNPIDCRGSRQGDLDYENLNQIWLNLHPKQDLGKFSSSNSNTTRSLDVLRQLALCNRTSTKSENNLLILIEAADMLLPEEQISRMSEVDRHRVGIIHDWFCDPEFMQSSDTVVLISESRGDIHNRISRLPQVLSVDVPLPDLDQRKHFAEWFSKQNGIENVPQELAEQTSGLSIHAIRQLLLSRDFSTENIASKVESYMISQLGEGVVEFKRPKHKLNDCIGFRRVKKFMVDEIIPGFQSGQFSGAAVGGPIGGGKTYICEAVAAELGIPVILLKNIRSKWFGETDAVFERLRRLLETFHKIVIFVDEADTQFGSVEGGHDTERRLTGKIQAMMSDTALKGKVVWFLMTARIHLLSPDIRRPGRMDAIIPILDPEGEDRDDFINWCFKGLSEDGEFHKNEAIQKITNGYSSAAFSALRDQIKSKKCKSIEEALAIANDMILPDIQEARDFQTLQAKLNCTRISLLFSEEQRSAKDFSFEEERRKWNEQIKRLQHVQALC